WVFAEFIVVDGDVTTLPVIEVPGISAQSTAPITGTIGVTGTSPVIAPTATAAPALAATPTPAAESVAGDVTASVNTILGTAVRAAPDTGADALATAVYENVLTVIGRSADNAWLQVDLGEQQGWVQASSVDLSVDIATLPVTTP
ncbi:MAG: SH3 domain-containing protein, partial [Caldilineaceae bacterium]|nr:SH3 domain-containing protein [Caldilineaceae bacterium]